jgi:small redox-active disulfide protein 2
MMKVQIYVTICARCQEFQWNLEEAIKELNLDLKVEKIGLDQATKMGILGSPSIIIDGKIKSSGIILSVDELKKLLTENM